MRRARGDSQKTDSHADALWVRYRADPGPTATEDLIVHYTPLVVWLADRLARRAAHTAANPVPVDRDDLIQVGRIALAKAIARYDPSRGRTFTAFASRHVRGAMIDQLRAMDWTPRAERAAGNGRGLVPLAEDLEAPREAERSGLLDLVQRGLTRRERLVILLYYAEGLTMREVAETLGLSESHVGRIHREVVGRLRARLAGRREELLAD